MKKISVIIASLVLFAGMTFAQNSAGVTTSKKAPAGNKTGSTGGTTSGTTSGTTNSAPVKKVPPPSKTSKATPAVKGSQSK